MHACECMCLGILEGGIEWNGVRITVSCEMSKHLWFSSVLGNKLSSSAMAASALNYWAISAAPEHFTLFFKLQFKEKRVTITVSSTNCTRCLGIAPTRIQRASDGTASSLSPCDLGIVIHLLYPVIPMTKGREWHLKRIYYTQSRLLPKFKHDICTLS